MSRASMSAQGKVLFRAITEYVEALVQHELSIHERDNLHKIRVGPPDDFWQAQSAASIRCVGEATRDLQAAIEDLVGR